MILHVKTPLCVDDGFFSEELDLKGRTKIRISFFLFSLIVKSVCGVSVGEVEELTKHWAFDMIAKSNILFFFCVIGISVGYWIKDKTCEASALTLKVWQERSCTLVINLKYVGVRWMEREGVSMPHDQGL